MRLRILAALVIAFAGMGTDRALAQDAVEVSAGWRHLYVAGSDGEDGVNIPRGWYVDISLPLSPMFSIVGDVGGHYDSETTSEVVQGVTVTGSADASVHTFMGGVRVRGRDPRVSPFAQVLFGAVRASVSAEGSATVGGTPLSFDFEESESEAGLSIGGGVNLRAGSLGVRVQGEWVKVLAEDSGNAFRFGAGVVIPF
jgi:hypothetical protein